MSLLEKIYNQLSQFPPEVWLALAASLIIEHELHNWAEMREELKKEINIPRPDFVGTLPSKGD